MFSGCWTWELSQAQILSDTPWISKNLSSLHWTSIHVNKQIKEVKRILQKIFLQEKKDYFNWKKDYSKSIEIELFEFYFNLLIDCSNSSSALCSVHVHWNRNLIKKSVEVSNKQGHLIDWAIFREKWVFCVKIKSPVLVPGILCRRHCLCFHTAWSAL